MHGPAVISLLMGKSSDGAGSEVYFLENPAGKPTRRRTRLSDKAHRAQQVPAGKQKNNMVGFRIMSIQAQTNQGVSGGDKACEKAGGIMVWLCGEPLQLKSADFLPLSDKTTRQMSYRPLVRFRTNGLPVCSDGRPYDCGDGFRAKYIYWSEAASAGRRVCPGPGGDRQYD
jgi:hypothetical protein